MNGDPDQLEQCLSKGAAFRFRDTDVIYALLLDMDSFIFETRSLYEIVGKFLISLFQLLFDRKMTEDELQSLLSSQNIDIRVASSWGHGVFKSVVAGVLIAIPPILSIVTQKDLTGERQLLL